MSEAIVDAWAPRIGDDDREGRVGRGTARRQGEIHPVGRVQVFGSGPDGSHLHLFASVDERLRGAAVEVRVVDGGEGGLETGEVIT